MRSGLVRVSGLVAVALAMVATGCDSSSQAGRTPPTTVGPGGLSPLPTSRQPTAPPAPGERQPDRKSFLVRAETCERFAEAVRPVALEAVGPYGFNGGPYGFAEDSAAGRTMAGSVAPSAAGTPGQVAAPKAGVDFSATNVQEAGIDEPDAVKTDGRLLVTTIDGRLRVTDVTGPARLVSTLDLPAGSGDLLLVGDRAMVMSGSQGRSFLPGTGVVPGVHGGVSSPDGVAPRPTTAVTVVDLKDPAKPVIARTHTIDGSYLDARLVGGVARIVTRSQPDLPFPQPSAQQPDPEKATASNAEIVSKASPAAFLPKGASCGDAYVPLEASGVGTIAVQSLDPAAENPGPAVTVVANASTVYASGSRLFVATNRYDGGGPVRSSRTAPVRTEASRTAIHAFDISDPAKARYAGSGDVPGTLLNQFSLSEHEGVLRVATTLDAQGFITDGPQGTSGGEVAPSQSRVSILRPAGEAWVETGFVDGLGKGERIYAVRFLGATGYVVTFRQVDPLYVLDLRDVRAPKVAGELKITGYSAYLHPAGDGRLLGLGQEASDQGRRLGPQLSLFDVGDPSAPTKLAGAVLSQGNSSAESDHHAFLFWPATGLVVVPITSYGGGEILPAGGEKTFARPFVGAVAFKVGDTSVTESGRITHPGSTPIERSLVVGDRLLTVSRIGVATNDLGSLADGGFVAFR